MSDILPPPPKGVQFVDVPPPPPEGVEFVDTPPPLPSEAPGKNQVLNQAKINLSLHNFDDPEEEAARINNATFVSDNFDVAPAEAYDQVDEYVAQLTGEEKPPHKKFAQEIRDAWDRGRLSIRIGQIGNEARKAYKDGNQELFDSLVKEYDQVEKQISSLEDISTKHPKGVVNKVLGFGRRIIPGMAGLIGQQVEIIAGERFVKEYYELQEKGPFSAEYLRFAMGQGIQPITGIGESEAGAAYMDMIKAGVDPQIADMFAQGIGTINNIIEFSEYATFIKLFPGADRIISQATGSLMRKLLLGPAMKNTALRLTTKLGMATIEQLGQELAQEAVTFYGENWAMEINDAVKGTELEKNKDFLDRAKTVVLDFLPGVLGLGALPIGMQAVTSARGKAAQRAGARPTGAVEKLSSEQEELLKTVSEGYRTETDAVPTVVEPTPEVKQDMKESRLVEIEGEKYTRKEVRQAQDEARETKISELVKELEALKTGTGARALGKAYTAGKEVGLSQQKKTTRETQLRAIARREQHERLNHIISDLKKVQSKLDIMSEAQAQPIHELIDGLDFAKHRESTIIRLERTRQYFENNPEVEISDSIKERLETLDKHSIRDLSMDEIEDVYTAVMHHFYLEKRKQQIRIGLKDHKATMVISQSMNEMKPPKQIAPEIVSSKITPVEKAKAVGRKLKNFFVLRHKHYDLIIEQLAGPNSTMDKVLFQGVKEGIREQLRYRQETFKTFQQDVEKTNFKQKDVNKWLNERIKIGKFDLTRDERMTLYNCFLNEDNRDSMLVDGVGFRYGPDPNQVYTITHNELIEIMNSLTPDERAFAGTPVRNLFENQYNKLNPVFKEKNGYELPKEDIYFPKDVMPISRGTDIEKETALEKFRGQWTRVGLEKGMLERRRRVHKPIYISPLSKVINKSVMNSAAYIGLELPLSDASKLLYNKNFRSQMILRYGKETWNEIEKGLQDIAGEGKSYTDVEEAMLKIRARLSTAILGLNPFVMLKQPLSYSMYSTYVKPEYLLQGIVDYMTHPKEIIERHKLYSPEYLERLEGGFSRDIQEVTRRAGPEKRLYKGKAKISERIMGGIKWFDKQAVTPGMQSAVLQVLSEFQEGKLSNEVKTALDMRDNDIAGLSAEEKMQKAYRFAEYCTNRTQPPFSAEHRSSLSRGTPVEKLFTQFTAFTNQALNLLQRTLNDAVHSKSTLATKRAARAVVSVMLINTMGNIALDELRNRIYGRDDEDKIYMRLLKNWAGMIYIIRDVFQSLTSKINKGTYAGYEFSMPVLRYVNTWINAGAHFFRMILEPSKKQRHKEALRFADKSAEALLMTFGLPYTTPKKLIQRGVEVIKD